MKTNNLEELIGKNYEIVYADPPWKYYGDPDKDQAAGKHYECMSFDALASMPIRKIMAPKAVMFMWATSAKLSDACSLFTEWGFFYRGVFQVWVKTSMGGAIIHGQGVRPSFTKPTAEYLLVGSTEEKGRTFPINTEAMPNVVLAPRPNNVHSKKPGIFRDNIVELLGDRPRVELFAREESAGWDVFGNEV